ncbi:hypothetical protein BDV95DRAFT_490144 [Massariosphaeria phaeospora]|uniref:C2H2-type domain-containing protein n=1 Tax=Massariosphaeria phaeospora TaxID=100035 RepID=A0A7C8IBC5_9PLEO|nr:hypothetical protein BDV95DRAFT_490144 [Massariosphaeria phaeospora]
MTKKRKRYPDLQQKLERPWCYYCERDFDDLKILISHQKAKHFKCDRCGRRLNTAGGLQVHMTQVHKENLQFVENSVAGRQGLEVEIFGMEGVPPEVLDEHNQLVTHQHFEEEAQRAKITGNPVRGLLTNGASGSHKRERVKEELEEIMVHVDQWREDRMNGVIIAPPVQHIVAPPFAAGQPFPPNGAAFPAHFGGQPPMNGARPGSVPALPQRPSYGAPAQAPPGATAISASVDELISHVQGATTEAPTEKKSKKDKHNVRMVFNDDRISPEEKMAALPKYVEFSRS